MTISIAVVNDVPALVQLVNSAYRGDSSKAGWTTEAHIIGGEVRILPPDMEEMMRKPGAVFLKSVSDEGVVNGCVFLEKRGEQLYLGMLSVSPALQAKGTGKALLLAAEDYAKEQGCISVYMRVINLRKELIAWYERRGYKNTGKTEQYVAPSYEKVIQPFHFIIMEKLIPLS